LKEIFLLKDHYFCGFGGGGGGPLGGDSGFIDPVSGCCTERRHILPSASEPATLLACVTPSLNAFE